MFLLTCSAGLSSCGEVEVEFLMMALSGEFGLIAFPSVGYLPACAATVATATRLSTNTNVLLFMPPLSSSVSLSAVARLQSPVFFLPSALVTNHRATLAVLAGC